MKRYVARMLYSSVSEKFFGKGFLDQFEAVIDELKKLFVAQLLVAIDSVPMLFVHVVARNDGVDVFFT